MLLKIEVEQPNRQPEDITSCMNGDRFLVGIVGFLEITRFRISFHLPQKYVASTEEVMTFELCRICS